MLIPSLRAKNFDEVKELLKSGAKLEPNIDDFTKNQLFDILLQEKQFEILRHFLTDKTIETDIYEYDSFNRSIFERILLYLGTDDESMSFLENFVSHLENINDEVEAKTLLSYFFEKGAPLKSIEILIAHGADLNFKNNAEEGYLHQVVKTNLMKPDLSLSYLQYLLDNGLDANAANIVRQTPLHLALEFNRKEYLDLLLANGADANLLNKDGNNAFFIAVAQKLDLNLYQKLKEYDTPDFDLLNRDKVSLLFEYVRMLNAAGQNELQLLAELLKDGADPYHRSEFYGRASTPIDLIAEKKVEVLQTLLENSNIDINQQDDQGNTLLHKVCAFNVNYDAESAKNTYRKVKLLLEKGADATITNDKDQTALMLASDDNLKIKTVELLMK